VRDATEISDGAEEFALKNMMKYRGLIARDTAILFFLIDSRG